MEPLVTRPLPPTVPEVIRLGHGQLPSETLAIMEAQLQEIVTQHQLELSLIEQYKRGDIYLSDVSVALGHYPKVQKTMKWLGERGVCLGPSPELYDSIEASMKKILAYKRAAMDTPVIA